MDKIEEEILDMLRHLWFVKSYITDCELEKALCDLMGKRNPFLRLKDKLKTKHLDNISFNSDIWNFKLPNDINWENEVKKVKKTG